MINTNLFASKKLYQKICVSLIKLSFTKKVGVKICVILWLAKIPLVRISYHLLPLLLPHPFPHLAALLFPRACF